MNRLLCWFFGHITNHFGGSVIPCTRCGETHEDALQHLGAYWLIRHHWLYRRPNWLYLSHYQKCPDCGQRFNHHTSDCPPF